MFFVIRFDLRYEMVLLDDNCENFCCRSFKINQLDGIVFWKMADKASSSAAKDAPSTKTVLELLEEDDEFEVRSLVKWV